MEKLLNGGVILVTGGGQGIGKAAVLGAAAEGAAIAVVDINLNTAEAVARQVRDGGGRAIACAADMSRSDAIAGVFDRTEAELGPVTGLVCAGMRRHYAPAELMTDEQWDIVIGDGLTGYFRCAREAARRMLPTGGGAMVFVTSTAARSAIVNGAAYVSAKTGITGLARQLGSEWADRGVRVNCVAPGYTPTEGAHRKLGDEEALRLIPMGRTAAPSEIADACIYLLSPRSSYVTGQEIVADGGMVSSRIFGRTSATV